MKTKYGFWTREAAETFVRRNYYDDEWDIKPTCNGSYKLVEKTTPNTTRKHLMLGGKS